MVTAKNPPSLTKQTTLASTYPPSLQQQQPKALGHMPSNPAISSQAGEFWAFEVIYAKFNKSFMILFYHGGAFETMPLKYVEDKTKFEYNVQCHSLSYTMLIDMVASLGYRNVVKIHYKHPDSSLFEGLRILIGDKDIPKMLGIVKSQSCRYIKIYLEHEDVVKTINEEGNLEEECDYSDEELSGDSEGDSDDELIVARNKVKQHKKKNEEKL